MGDRAVRVYRDIFTTIHHWVSGTTADLTAESASWSPGGNCATAGGNFAHLALGQDFFINTLIRNAPKLSETTFAGKTGFDLPYPDGPWTEWARTARFDLDQLRTYCDAVFANTDAYLATLTDADLDREIDLSGMGWGIKTVSGLLDMIAVDGASHNGETSAIKGMQGKQGYPF